MSVTSQNENKEIMWNSQIPDQSWSINLVKSLNYISMQHLLLAVLSNCAEVNVRAKHLLQMFKCPALANKREPNQ